MLFTLGVFRRTQAGERIIGITDEEKVEEMIKRAGAAFRLPSSNTSDGLGFEAKPILDESPITLALVAKYSNLAIVHM